jgi:hypothetical protein
VLAAPEQAAREAYLEQFSSNLIAELKRAPKALAERRKRLKAEKVSLLKLVEARAT